MPVAAVLDAISRRRARGDVNNKSLRQVVRHSTARKQYAQTKLSGVHQSHQSRQSHQSDSLLWSFDIRCEMQTLYCTYPVTPVLETIWLIRWVLGRFMVLFWLFSWGPTVCSQKSPRWPTDSFMIVFLMVDPGPIRFEPAPNQCSMIPHLSGEGC